MRARTGIAALVLALAGLGVAACGASGGDGTTSSDAPSSDATATDEATTTEAPTTTEAQATTSTAPPTTSTTEPATTSTEPANGLSPGDPCSLEEGSPDCIDPDGDGEGTYLIGGADCMANAPDPALCTDLDGDGRAGYPDSQ
jgi:hypothetical protein